MRVTVRVQVAQTNIQLYNQLREAGYALDDILFARRAYDLLIQLYPGHYQADGKPFCSHGIGVASALAEAGQSADILAVGMLHNVYGNADFGDGRAPGAWPERRELVRAAIGERLETLLFRYRDLREHFRDLECVRRILPSLDETERGLVLVELADHLEKNIDLGCLYYGNGDWVLEGTQRHGDDLVAIANELDQPRLAEMLRAAFEDVAAAANEVPPELRSRDGRRYLKVIVPRSYTQRLPTKIRPFVRQRAGALIRLRGELRAAAGGAGRPKG